MNDKVAAAVELKARFSQIEDKIAANEMTAPQVFTQMRTAILAELGRLSGGEPVAWIQAEPCVTLADLHSEHFELIHSAQLHFGKKPPTKNQDANKLFALFTRPPALGELSDEQLAALFDYVDDERGKAAMAHYKSGDGINSWESKRSGIIAKAYRQFLGKVE